MEGLDDAFAGVVLLEVVVAVGRSGQEGRFGLSLELECLQAMVHRLVQLAMPDRAARAP